MTTDATSFVLRFRDLVTGVDETIKRHNLIAKDGYTWWGWWRKIGEQAPAHTLTALLDKSLPILLLDSGTQKLYRANCLGVEFDLEKPMPSPEKEKTPEYYRDETYYAWFQLSDFDQVPPESAATVLNSLAYIQVDEMFADGSSPFSTFYDKKIYDAQELIQQNRTIWFTRPATGKDPGHQIELLNAEHARPYRFSRTHYTTTARTLLWVSDLHFSKSNYHGFPDEPLQYDNLWNALDRALKEHGTEDIGGVIVSGDITWQAAPDEFDQARKIFFDRIISKYKLDPRQLAIVPGNHDIAFSKTPAEKRALVTQATAESVAAYSKFYSDLFKLGPNKYLSGGRRLLIAGGLPVDIVCLNSSLLQQHPDFTPGKKTTTPLFQGQGFIGADQLQDAAAFMKWRDEPFSRVRPLRIVVLHHHLMPVTEAEDAIAGGNYSTVLDAERLSRWLVRKRVDIVLHGHQHQPFSVQISRPESLGANHSNETHSYRVLGMGSTGVAARELGAIAQNTFGLVEFNPTNICIKFFTLHPKNRSNSLFEVSFPYPQDGQ